MFNYLDYICQTKFSYVGPTSFFDEFTAVAFIIIHNAFHEKVLTLVTAVRTAVI